MSLLKWTLAMAGTAMGMRYLSNRQRSRLGGGIGAGPVAQSDRDWTAPQGAGGGIHRPGSDNPGSGAYLDSRVGNSGAASVGQDDLLAPHSDLAPGSSTSRF